MGKNTFQMEIILDIRPSVDNYWSNKRPIKVTYCKTCHFPLDSCDCKRN